MGGGNIEYGAEDIECGSGNAERKRDRNLGVRN